jgi:acyl carrier protein
MSNETIAAVGTVPERFAQIVAASLRIDRSLVTEEASLIELGAESLDLVEITMDIEEEFNVLVPEQNILDTAQEILGPGVLINEGRLTPQGVRLIRARLPELAVTDDAELTMADLNRNFMRVGSWVQLIERLMANTPRACPSCATRYGRQVAGRVTCPACGTGEDIPAGDDLNRAWVEQFCREEHLLPRSTPSAPSTPAASESI